MKVLNLGSLNIDYVYDVKSFVRAGETISSTMMEKFHGGKGLNQSIALAKSGVEVYHAGIVGESDGEFLKQALLKAGVKTDFIRKTKNASGHAIIQRDENGQNCIILYGGANLEVTEEMVDDILVNFDEGDYIILQNEISSLDYIIDRAYQKKMIIVLNPSPMNDKILDCNLDKVTYFMLNEVEAKELCHKDGTSEEQVNALREMFPQSKFILTRGSKGSVYSDNNQMIEQEIYKVPVVDTTAAGDTFTGFFLGSLIREYTISECLKTATAASSLAVSKKGASVSIPTWNEARAFKLGNDISDS